MHTCMHDQGGDHSFKFKFFPKKERKHEDLILKMVSLGFKWEYTKYGNKHVSIIHLPILKIKTLGFEESTPKKNKNIENITKKGWTWVSDFKHQ